MLTDKGYRFTLQFPNRTESQVTVGELLERSGSKKSRLVVEAVAEYIERHTDTLTTAKGVINIEATPAPPVIPKKEIEYICKAILEKMLADRNVSLAPENSTVVVNTAVSSMLDNMGDFFK